MSSKPRLFSQWPNITVQDIVRVFPDTRLDIITRHPDKPERLVVEWASPKQQETFPGLEGQICYERTKGFSRPCEWCPCLRAMGDRQVHVAVAPSPKHKTGAPGSAGYEHDVGEMTYAVVVAIPIESGPDGSARVLELSLDHTEQETIGYEHRTREYEFIATLCRSMEAQTSTDTADEFVLFGAVAEASMAFREAHLFLPGDGGASAELSALVSQRLTLIQDRGTLPSLRRIQHEFAAEVDQVDLAPLRGILFQQIRRKTYVPPRPLVQALSEQGVPEPQRLEGQLGIPIGLRVHSQCAVVPVLGYHRRLHGVLLLKCHPNTLISDDDLVHLGIFALVVNSTYSRRDLINAYDQAVQKMQELTQSYGGNAEELLFSGAVVLGLGHDLRSSRRVLGDWVRTLIKEIPQSRRESKALSPVIKEVERALEFQKNCLTRIASPSRIVSPWFATYNIKKVILEVKSAFQHSLDEKGVTLNVRDYLSPRSETIDCDEFLIRQVLTNLIDNSLYWMFDPRKRVIEIALSDADEQHIHIDYRDTGVGIASEIHDQIWQPFFTLKPKGIGLGLFIVQRIVSSHGGKINLFSDSKWGACFRIRLPIRQ